MFYIMLTSLLFPIDAICNMFYVGKKNSFNFWSSLKVNL